MEIEKMTLIELVEAVKEQKISSEELVKYSLSQYEKFKNMNAIIEVFDDVLNRAKEIDQKIARGEEVGLLAGIPIAIKDNIMYKGKKMSCASNFLKDFISPYTSTVAQKLLNGDAIIFGRTNMDEFAMGGSCENSIYGACHNAINFDYVSGGSSGGSACTVALNIVPCAIGTDTGGSIRQPASFNGVVGAKPTYGTVSRYGIVAFASSLDQASPITKNVRDCEYVLKIISGKDEHDETSIDNKFSNHIASKKRVLGICNQIIEKYKDMPSYEKFLKAKKALKDEFDFVNVDIPHIQDCLACYYIIAPAEAASNLARFDGVKYTKRSEKVTDLESVYVKSRSEGFGKEVKRRIMLGNFVLSSGYFDDYYIKAKKVQKMIKAEFAKAFTLCDALMLPTTPNIAFKIGEKIGDPLSMYMEDLFTVPANITSLPALSIPYEKGENNLPLGMQFMCGEKNDQTLFEIAKTCEKIFDLRSEK